MNTYIIIYIKIVCSKINLIFILERYNQGIDVLNRGLSFNPGAHNLLFLLADTYKKAGKWPESERTYLEAISSHPNESALYFNLGKLLKEFNLHIGKSLKDFNQGT